MYTRTLKTCVKTTRKETCLRFNHVLNGETVRRNRGKYRFSHVFMQNSTRKQFFPMYCLRYQTLSNVLSM